MWNHAQEQSRRQFFTSGAAGLGGLALASLLSAEAAQAADQDPNPLAPKKPHFAPRAKNCIFIFLAGAPSHVDLYDPKPILQEQHGQALPKSLTEKVRFAFIKKESHEAVCLGRNQHLLNKLTCPLRVAIPIICQRKQRLCLKLKILPIVCFRL